MGLRVTIAGFGVAGSVAAYKLAESGASVTVFDPKPSYDKACGEVIPYSFTLLLDREGVPKPPKLNTISVFAVYVLDKLVKKIEFGKPVWISIDKSKWINTLREAAQRRGVTYRRSLFRYREAVDADIVVDARGPWSSRGRKIAVWQAYAKTSWPGNVAVLSFSAEPLGLAWIFPHSGFINIGAGYVGVSVDEAEKTGLKIVRTIVERVRGTSVKLVAKRYAPLTVKPVVELYRGGVLLAGEAAGLVMSLGGEGIRPAVLSGLAIVKAITSSMSRGFKNIVSRYKALIKDVYVQSRLQSWMFSRMSMIGNSELEKVLRRLSNQLYYKWFNGRLPLYAPLYMLLLLF